MGVFFGTDGLRGKVNDDLSYHTAYKCGNALASYCGGMAKILIGTDTRKSASLVTLAFACGAVNGGMSVTSVGVCPTAGVSYLTKKFGYDFGVVISASHNPAEFNGIKIFDNSGVKLGDRREEQIEKLFLKEKAVPFDKLGEFLVKPELVKEYIEFLISSTDVNFKGTKVVLDCANGASSFVAPEVFKKLGAKVIALSNEPNGLNINQNCGSLNLQNLILAVKKYHADVGFAYDGDSDRVIAVDELGRIVNGDKLIFMFATAYSEQGKLIPPAVVGTRHTNMGVERALERRGISLIRTEIGDKYVSAKLAEENLLIGGEQSGHIILRDKHVTGDGILASIVATSIMIKKGVKFSEFFNFEEYHQANLNVEVSDKIKVINSEKLSKEIEIEEMHFSDDGRIMVRVSGTEPYIRIMVESKSNEKSEAIAEKLEKIVRDIDRGL